ncbi:MAG: Phosphoesterase [candidate division TM6 bacterium GW2011_GWF2_32_72]|nr:MAG: Phosphoesterase [candidate division TM6 bacterium GW2011_GWF2_32_72]
MKRSNALFCLLVIVLACNIALLGSASSIESKSLKIKQAEFEKIDSKNPFKKQDFRSPGTKKVLAMTEGTLRDVLELNLNIFSRDTMKVLTVTMPGFLLGRMMDRKVNSVFYDLFNHKDLRQCSHYCRDWTAKAMYPAEIFLASEYFWSNNDRLRTTSWYFMLGLPFVMFSRQFFYGVNVPFAYRPGCGRFPKKIKMGGFPSGHISQISYMATLYGLRHGKKWGIPLGLLGLTTFSVFLNSNRHFVSQMVAGAGLGSIYAFAVKNLIEKRELEFQEPGCKRNNLIFICAPSLYTKGVKISVSYTY